MRPIDGDALKNQIRHMPRTINPDLVQYSLVQAIIADMPTLTPPNEWVSRVQELDELYTKLQIATGFTAEQLLEMFAAGYTLEKPDYSKHFEAMANLAESDPPNEPLTLEQLREMKGQPVWTVTTGIKASGRWELVCDVDYEDVLEMACCVDGFYHIEVNTYGSTWNAYRRPPEGEEDT